MAKTRKTIKAITHDDIRKNIPTAEYHAAMKNDERSPIQVAYERRNRDLDPQLVWRGKDEQDQTNLIAQAPPLYIQEKIHPKAIIDDLERHSRAGAQPDDVIDLFADFNGLPSEAARTEFYQHDANWSNRMILGDSLHVMASLAEREGLRGKVQCIYFDPPYGIKFNSNFQWSTTSRTVRDGNKKHITREPEQVKAFRDAWQDGVHSYLAYLRDRLLVARDLLADTGSVFVQIGDENVHRVRLLMDEVFGNDNCMSIITYKTSVGLGSQHLDNTTNHLVWYSKNKAEIKYRRLYRRLEPWKEGATRYKHVRMPDLRERRVTTEEIRSLVSLPTGARLFRDQGFTSRSGSATTRFSVEYRGRKYYPSVGGWRTSEIGMQRAIRADRALQTGSNISYRKYFDDFDAIRLDNFWNDVSGGITSRSDPKIYVVQTSTKIVQRCILMTTDPGDLVLDPTCGAGTTAYVAEQWGRRWITIDTSRVALALSRARIMGARYPYYLLADSPEGQQAEATVAHKAPSETATYRRIRQGFVYERVPRITLKRIANNTEIDVIWNASEEILEPLRVELNRVLEREWSEWDIPREPGDPWPPKAAACWNRLRKASTDPAKTVALRTLNQQLGRNYELNDVPDEPRDPWPSAAASLHTKWWEARVSRQRKIDASITASAPFEYL